MSTTSISLITPLTAALVNNLAPTLQWSNNRRDVFYYEVQLSKDSSFNTDPATATAMIYSGLIHGGVTTLPNSYSVPPDFPLQPDTTYYWRVRPRIQGDGDPLPWSTASQFLTVQGDLSLWHIGMSTKSPPHYDVRVRRAFWLTTDDQALLAAMAGRPASVAVSAVTPSAAKVPPHLVDLVAARRLMAEAGYSNGFSQQLHVTDDPIARQLAVVAVAGWEPLGIRTEVVYHDSDEFNQGLQSQKWKLWIGSATTGPPYDLLSQFYLSTSGLNYTGYHYPKVDELLLAAERSTDPLTRVQFYEQVETITMGDLSIMPLLWLPAPASGRESLTALRSQRNVVLANLLIGNPRWRMAEGLMIFNSREASKPRTDPSLRSGLQKPLAD